MRPDISMRILAVLLALTVPITAAAQTSATVPAIADAYVREGASASTNFGSSTELQVRKTSPSSADNRISYLKFDISSLPASLAWARVLVYAKLSGFSDFGVTVGLSSVPSTTWEENSITWNSRPALGSSLSSATVTDTAFAWKVFLVTDYLRSLRSQGISTASVALNNPLTSTPHVIANSRESTSNQPVLEYLTTVPPTVSITYPNDNEVFTPSPATITLTSSASDPDGSIARVEYYHGSTLIGQSTGPYYSYELNWPNVPTGIYSLTAKAVDNWGVTTTSAPVVVTVNSSPSVTMTSPTSGGPFPAPAVVTLTASAADPDGAISRVEFYQVSQTNPTPALIATLTSPPYTFNQTLSAPDTYTFYARAVDNLNGQALAASPSSVTVTGQVSSLHFIHTDHLNTPRLIANGAGQAVWRWDQADPFGGNGPNENPSGLGTFTCNLRLPGQYFDKETNLHYNYFRDYDPGIGRYVQADPLGITTTKFPTATTAGLNHLYAYVGSNPLSYVDPEGLQIAPGGSAAGAGSIFGPAGAGRGSNLILSKPKPPDPADELISPQPSRRASKSTSTAEACTPSDRFDACRDQWIADTKWCDNSFTGRLNIACHRWAEEEFSRCKNGSPRQPFRY